MGNDTRTCELPVVSISMARDADIEDTGGHSRFQRSWVDCEQFLAFTSRTWRSSTASTLTENC